MSDPTTEQFEKYWEEYNRLMQKTAAEAKAEVQPCPHCGHCPTCGRGPTYRYWWHQTLPGILWPNTTSGTFTGFSCSH